MIDNLAILFALSAIVYVVVRAILLQALRPWYDKEGRDTPPEQPKKRRGIR